MSSEGDAVFGPRWAQRLERALAADARYRVQTRWFRGVVRLDSPQESAQIEVGEEGSRVRSPAAAGSFAFGLSGPAQSWRELFEGPRASLNSSVRRGDLVLTGDRAALLKWWLLMYQIAEAARRAASERQA